MPLKKALRTIASFGPGGMPVFDIPPELKPLSRYRDRSTGEMRGLGLVELEQDLSERPILRLKVTEKGRRSLRGA